MLRQQAIQFSSRVFRAATLDNKVYAEIFADYHATGQSLLVVLAVSLSTGIGALDEEGLSGIKLIPAGFFLASLSWIVGGALAYFIGKHILSKGSSGVTLVSVARAIGFAQSPGLLRIFGLLPGLGAAVLITTLLWQLFTTIVAIKQSFAFSSYWKAAGVMLLGFPFYAIIMWGALLILEAS